MSKAENNAPANDAKLDAIKDIIFGDTLKLYDAKFEETEKSIDAQNKELSKEIAQAKKELGNTLNAIQKKLDALSNKLSEVDNRKSDRATLAELLREVAKKIEE